jgi:leucyl aminopeptidase
MVKMSDWIINITKKLDFSQLETEVNNNKIQLNVGMGLRSSLHSQRLLIHKAVRFLNSIKANITELKLEGLKPNTKLVLALLEATYSFEKYKTKKNTVVTTPKKIYGQLTPSEKIILDAIQNTKDLVNEPANIVTPLFLKKYAESLSKKHPTVKVKVFSPTEAKKKGLNTFLAVGEASDNEPYFIDITYQPLKSDKKDFVALVGKGLTYDTGGLCLKPNNYMYGMKSDMAGAATVINIIDAAASLKIKTPLRAVVPACENSFNENSFRPGDVIKSFSGKSIEIVDTDAEGRLVLADALSYLCEDKRVKTIIDYATLTGSCVAALGEAAAGAFSNNTELLSKFKQASTQVGEQVWQLPLFEEYREDLESDIADILQCKGRPDANLAAVFLKEFVTRDDVEWLHLDVAGTAFIDEANEYLDEGATGWGVWSTLNFLLNCEENKQ